MIEQHKHSSIVVGGLEQNKGEYRLINGVFDPAQATDVLMTLIDDKIRFHQRNNLTSQERFGEPDAASTRRIDELRLTKDNLAALIAEAASSGQKLAINCAIEINLAADASGETGAARRQAL